MSWIGVEKCSRTEPKGGQRDLSYLPPLWQKDTHIKIDERPFNERDLSEDLGLRRKHEPFQIENRTKRTRIEHVEFALDINIRPVNRGDGVPFTTAQIQLEGLKKRTLQCFSVKSKEAL